MTYLQFLDLLKSQSEAKFAQFQKRLIPTRYEILGVRTPTMRKLAHQYVSFIDEIWQYPNEYYEVVFIKLTMVSLLPYVQFLKYLKESISLIDNWALCDCFKAKCIQKNKDDFLIVLNKLFDLRSEYAQRYVLVTMLSEYISKEYFSQIEYFIKHADTSLFYIHMAVAWLVAEILVKEYDFGLYILRVGILDTKTYNKAIQKATESFRIKNEQKEYLCSLKINLKK